MFVSESCLSFVYNFSNFLFFLSLRFGLPTQDMSCGQNKINQSVSPVGENIIQIYKERESVCAREREREISSRNRVRKTDYLFVFFVKELHLDSIDFL